MNGASGGTDGTGQVLRDSTNLPPSTLCVRKVTALGRSSEELNNKLDMESQHETSSNVQAEAVGGNVDDLFDGLDESSSTANTSALPLPNPVLSASSLSSKALQVSAKTIPTSSTTKPPFVRPAVFPTNSSFVRPAVSGAALFSSSSDIGRQNGRASRPRAFSVMYTKKSTKKRKTFSDGVLAIRDGKMILFDSEGKQISQARAARMSEEEMDRLGAGSQLEVGTQEVEVCSAMDYDVVLSGKAFLGTTTTTPMPSASSIAKLPKFTSVGSSTSVMKLPPSSSAAMFDPDAEDALVLMRPEESSGGNTIVVDPAIAHRLRPHQREGVRFMFECVTGMRSREFQGQGCVLADDMGLGKSIQAITLIWTLLKQGPVRGGPPFVRKTVIVCPASLVDNWCREVAKFLGPAKLRPIAVVTDPGAEAEKKLAEFITSRVRPLLIISYETYRKHCDRLNRNCPGLDLLVCDEGHRLKSAEGNKTIQALSAAPTQRRIILTGTPLQNQLEEFFAVVSFVNPNVLGRDVKHFKRVFQVPIEQGRDRTATEEQRETARARSKELQRLTCQFVLRRTAEVNRSRLPPKRETTVFVRLSRVEQEELYLKEIQSKSVESLLSSSSSGSEGKAEALRLVTRLKQVCTHPLLLSPSSSSSSSLVATSGKFQFLDVLLKGIREEDSTNRVVLVSSFTSTLDLLARLCELRGYGYLRLDGSTRVSDRQRLVNRFNRPASSADSSFVFLLSSKAGGCGLNLIGANRLVLVDPDWNPAIDKQAMARVWRDGQTKPVFVYRLLATGTIEERVFQRQIMKETTAGGVLNEGSSSSTGVVGQFSRAELKKLFQLRLDTLCDTYEMLSSSSSSSSTEWPEYRGPESIESDSVLRRAAETCEAVTWVHQNESSSVAAAAVADEQEETALNEEEVIVVAHEGDEATTLDRVEEEELGDGNDDNYDFLHDDDEKEESGERDEGLGGVLKEYDDLADDGDEDALGDDDDLDDDGDDDALGNDDDLDHNDDAADEEEAEVQTSANERKRTREQKPQRRRRLIVEDDD